MKISLIKINKIFFLIMILAFTCMSISKEKVETTGKVITSNPMQMNSRKDIIEQEGKELILKIEVMNVDDFQYPFDEYTFYKNDKYIFIRFFQDYHNISIGNGAYHSYVHIYSYDTNELLDILNSENLYENIKKDCLDCDIFKGKELLNNIVISGMDVKYKKNKVTVFSDGKEVNEKTKMLKITMNKNKKVFLLLNDEKLYKNNDVIKLINFFNKLIIE